MGQLKIGIRSLARRASYDRLASVLALTLGMATLLVILICLRSELSYDRFHRNAGRIYRMYEGFLLPGKPPVYTAFSPLIMAPTLRRELPEVAEAARVLPYLEGSVPGKVAVRGRQARSYESFSWADEGIFRIFTLPLLAGDPSTALTAPNAVILARSVARRYFAGQPPLGQVLKIDTGFSDEDYRVTGVFEDLPYNSHFHPAVLASFRSLDHVRDPRIFRSSWWANDAYTYVLLADGAPAARLRAELPVFAGRHYTGMPDIKATLAMQPLTDIHLRSHLQGEVEANGDVKNVRFLAAAAAAMLLVTLCNFMALSTCCAAGRRREAAIMTILGARRRHLFARYFAESLVLAVLALALAAALVRVALPAIDALTGKPMAPPGGLAVVLVLAGLALLAAAAAGGALVGQAMAGQRAVGRGLPGAGGGMSGRWPPRRGVALRGALAAIELAAAAVLLAGAGVVADQARFMRRQDLGFDDRHVLVVPMRDVSLRDRLPELKAAMARGPGIAGVSFASLVLAHDTPQTTVQVAGSKSSKVMGALIADPDLTRVLHLQLAAGRELRESDAASGFLINESAVRLWGLGSPQAAVGKSLDCGIKAGSIVGVLRDFHHQPLQQAIEPLFLHIRPLNYRYMYLDVEPPAAAAALRHLDEVWRRMVPDKPCERFFLAGEYDRAYQGEERLARLAGLAGAAVLVIACLGLLGFARFAAEQRAPELAVRHALGSSRAALVRLLVPRLAAPAAVALLAAWPLSQAVMTAWLDRFAYHTEVAALPVAGAAAVMLAAALLTVGVPARRAARPDAPAGAAATLRYP